MTVVVVVVSRSWVLVLVPVIVVVRRSFLLSYHGPGDRTGDRPCASAVVVVVSLTVLVLVLVIVAVVVMGLYPVVDTRWPSVGVRTGTRTVLR